MKTGFSRFPRALSSGIVLALAVVYLFQVAPHGHVDDHHAESHHTPHTHGNHAHLPADGTDEQSSSGNEHHHHSVAQHLDFHFARLCQRAVEQEQGNPVALAETVEPIHASLCCGFIAVEPVDPAPDDPLLLRAPSRAPPA